MKENLINHQKRVLKNGVKYTNKNYIFLEFVSIVL